MNTTNRFRAGQPLDIEASQRAFMAACEKKEPIEFAGDEPWTFGEWLCAFLIGFCVLMICVAVLLQIKPL